MDQYAIAQYTNALFMLVVGFYVLIKNPASLVNRIFFLHNMAVMVWSFSFAKMATAQSPAAGLIWSKMLHVGAMFIPSLLLHLFLLVTDRARTVKPLIISCYIISAVMVALLPTNLLIDHTINVVGFKFFVGPTGIWYHFFPLFFASCVSYAFVQLISAYKKAEGLKKKQLKYLIIGAAFGYLSGPGGFYPLYNIRIPQYSFYGVSIFVGIVAYAVVRYRLFDSEKIVKTAARHLVILSINTLVVFITSTLYSKFTHAQTDIYLMSIVVAVTTSVFVLAFNRMYYMDRWADKFFNKDQTKIYHAINNIQQHIKSLHDQNAIFDHVLKSLGSELENVDIYLKERKEGNYHSVVANNYEQGLDKRDALIRILEKNVTIVETDELIYFDQQSHSQDKLELVAGLQKLNVALAIPMAIDHKMIGVLLLGRPKNRLGFAEREIIELDNLAFQLALSVENYRLYEKMINDNKMELIGTMAASFAHEIRNPLTGAATYLELLPEKLDKPEFVKKFLDVVPREIKRVMQLTTDLLNFSKSGTLKTEPVKLKSLVERCLELLKAQLAVKQLRVDLVAPTDGDIEADSNQLYQVILNVMINAIHASHEGQTISIAIHTKEMQAIVSIVDKGEGISADNLQKIFEPFFSTRIYGTGLGLATCKRIVEGHGGKIKVQSEKKKGSTFEIILPRQVSPELEIAAKAQFSVNSSEPTFSTDSEKAGNSYHLEAL